MKKFVSLLIGLMMVFIVSAAMAETVTVAPGDTLEFDVNLVSASGNGAKIGIETNDAPVTFVSAVGGSVNDTVPPKAFNDFFVVVNIEGVDISADGTGLSGRLEDYTLGGSLASTADGKIGTVTFQVDTDAAEGTYTVEAFKSVGTCTVEGSITFEVKAASDRLPGDVNDDGEVDMRDSVLLYRYLADWGVPINMSNADVNADSEVDMRDSVLLYRYLADWGVTLQ